MRLPLVLLACCALGACHHASGPTVDPAALAALRADVRLVGGETTWVTRGRDYELVARSRADLALLQPEIDAERSVLAKVFPRDSFPLIVADVRRVTPPGQPYRAAAPLPSSELGAVVELVLADPQADASGDDRRRNVTPGPMPSPERPLIRAWLSSHASRLTAAPARTAQATGEVSDARIPMWAEPMIASLVNDSLSDRLTPALELRPESLFPIAELLTMPRPSPIVTQGGRGAGGERGGGEGTPGGGAGGTTRGRGPGGGIGGIGGGMGGRGGMGGGGGRGGMGRGGREGGQSSGQRVTPLFGPALYDAEAAVLARFLEREGDDLIGALIDARVLDRPIDDVLMQHKIGPTSVLEVDWRRWLSERAALLAR